MYRLFPLLLLCFCVGCSGISKPDAPAQVKKLEQQKNVIYQARFSKNAEGWKPVGKSDWCDYARVPGKTGALRVSRNSAEEAKVATRWESPVIRLNGKSAKISFFAADNYLHQQDFSYSAHIMIRSCTPDGKPLNTLKTLYTEWDNSVKSPYMWGKRTKENLIWRYYETTVPAGIDCVTLEFGYRGELVRGSCYLTDVMITEEKAAKTQQQAVTAKTNDYLLELSNPALAGIFYERDRRRFDALIRGPVPADAVLAIKVTDFEYNIVEKQTVDLKDAAPCKDEAFYKSPVAAQRKITRTNHKVKRFVLKAKDSAKTGILYRIHADLISGGKILASDTSLYMVTSNPPKKQTLDPSGSYFWTRNAPVHYSDGGSSAGKDRSMQDIPRKTGSVRSCSLSYSYNWRESQPVYPGPVKLKKKMPEYPVQTYMPNIEQVHVKRFIPDGAILETKERVLYAGRKGMELLNYNADAYADFILEYIRQNRKAIDWVIPSGLERGLNERVLKLQKKVYQEAHKRFPGIKVGFCINFVPVKDFDKHELWKYADFLNLHLYGATAGFPFNDSVAAYKAYYRKKFKRNAPPFTLTEGALRMPPGYINYAAGSMRGIWSLMEQNFVGIYYYHQNNLRPLSDPDTGEQLTSDPHSSLYDNYRFIQLVDRPIMAPELIMEKGYSGYRWTPDITFGGGTSFVPTLATAVYFNLIRDFDRTKLRFARMLPSAKVYVFDGKKKTVCGLDPREGSVGNPIIVHTKDPFIFRDLFGRTTKIVPNKGKALIQLGGRPGTLIFNRIAKGLRFTEMKSSGLEKLSVLAGETFRCAPALDKGFALSGTAQVSGEKQFIIPLGKKQTMPAMAPGTYPIRAYLKQGGNTWGILHNVLTVPDPLQIDMSPCPGKNPGFEITFNNASGKTVTGKVVYKNDQLCTTIRPEAIVRRFSIPAKRNARIFIPIDPKMVKMNFNELTEVEVITDDGRKFLLKERLHFRGVPESKVDFKIDASLDDWPLDKLTPIPLERVRMENVDEPAPDSISSPGYLYAMWKGTTLYMAAVINDTTPQSRFMDVNLWLDDNLLFGIYPWRYKEGSKFNPGFYRGHIGLHKDGTPGNYRENDIPAGGSADTSRIATAIKRQNGKIIYELAFPKGTLHPFVPAPGAGFRVSLTCFDATGNKRNYFNGILSYFGGANVNYHMDVNQWFEFICIK